MKEKQFNYNLRAIAFGLLAAELLINGILMLLYFVLQKQLSGLRLDKEYMAIALVAGPMVSLIFYLSIAWKNRALSRFGDTKLLPFFTQAITTSKTFFKFLLYRLALCFFTIGLINPKIGSKVAEGKSQGIDIMFCLDVSNSMLAEDIKPNRLSRAKRALEQLIDQLHGDRIGLIVFAGEAYVQLPLTTDYGAAKLFINTVDPSIVPVQGTAIGAALDMAMQSFDFEKEESGKAIVLISDGESHEGDAIVSAEHAADNKVMVHCIGMGSSEGVPIPIVQNGRQTGFRKDKAGNIVITKLGVDALASVASAGKGMFIQATTQDAGITALLKAFEKQTKKEFDSVVYVDYEDRFQWFLAAGLLLLLIETLLTEKRTKWMEKINWFNA